MASTSPETMPNAPGNPQPPAHVLPACAAPDARIPPQFVVFFRRSMPYSQFDDAPALQFACVEAPAGKVTAKRAYEVRFAQTWTLKLLALGDMSSTIALAPSEQLTLEIQNTQRRVLEQDTLDSAEAQDQTESTTIDKEVMNVARSASRNQSWHVDGSGSFSLGEVSLGLSGGVSGSLTQTSQTTMEHMTESTQKSSHTLKTLHKIEVRGVTEGTISNRMTRVIRNPYRDRTLSVNVYQLVKQFSVETKVAEVRPAVVIHVADLVFDDHFVIANGAFLRAELLDVDLADNLAMATQAATPLHAPASEASVSIAKTALNYLFGVPEIFNVRNVSGVNANDPANSFNAAAFGDNAGLQDALRNGMAPIFTTLNFFYKVYLEMTADGTIERTAVSMATGLAGALGPQWQGIIGNDSSQDQVKNILDQDNFTEPFRRLSGFLAMVDGMLRPLVGPAEDEQKLAADQARGLIVLTKLLDHLACNKNFYIQRYLEYVSLKTANQAIVDFIHDFTAQAQMSADEINQYDVERAFIDRQDIIIPAFDPLIPGNSGNSRTPPLDWTPPAPITADVDVPSDGIHLEVAAGLCILRDLPEPEPALDFNLKDLSLHIAQS